MTRRISALLGIVIIVGLALTLMYRVYLHHRASGTSEEPTVVERAVEKFASRAA
jgi:hypothetical protein